MRSRIGESIDILEARRLTFRLENGDTRNKEKYI